ncbi:MAG: hypothetical protein ACP5SI_02955 [Chloroflexia bacterium]
MKGKWLFGLVLCVLVALGSGCGLRQTETPAPPIIPAGTAAVPTPTAKPTAGPTQAGQRFRRPNVEMTVLGTLPLGIPWGKAQGDHYFEGDPNAPVMLIEFSDYQ